MELPADEPVADRCGSCSRCIDACPTDALSAYQLDATRCVSYLTIEHRGDVPESLRTGVGPWLYGCDVCQDVCPFNRRPTPATASQVVPRVPATLDVDRVLGWSVDEYRSAVKGTAIKRIKLPVMRRNAEIVRSNLRSEPGGSAAGSSRGCSVGRGRVNVELVPSHDRVRHQRGPVGRR